MNINDDMELQFDILTIMTTT